MLGYISWWKIHFNRGELIQKNDPWFKIRDAIWNFTFVIRYTPTADSPVSLFCVVRA